VLGVVLAVIGAVIVAPSGFHLLWRRQVAFLRRLLRKPRPAQSVNIEGRVTVSGHLTGTVTGRAPDPSASLDKQVAALIHQVERLEAQVNLVGDQLADEIRDRKQAVTGASF